MSMEPGVLRACGLRFERAGRTVLDGIDLSLASGDILALLGVNGAGKTTLLRCLLGLLRPCAGQVSLDGAPLASLSRQRLACRLAYVPQAHVAPFPFSVREVVTLGRLPYQGPFGAAGATDLDAVESAIDQLGIGALAERPYTELSGGERQLTLIARALAQGARLLIMDEPVSGLDFGHQIRLLRHLERLAADGYGILKTTHHPDHALACASRVAVLHQGRIEVDDVPDKVLTPERIRRLYRVDVEVLRVSGGRSVVIY
ncbi:ABC transporter ATP-binding protein [Azomonas macrocytogenes]|uniref:Iron complex transport system ATP-binding protein n=1 Tax=Azomonas macrocytogenes TaxID=69962 RepID=A0A839T5K9_AZOMA|nr:ABC transporter ATP-binding protein [Azomonas macrocytogenes]MBB3104329.1 iron complex transport system ATP-binding protein [Azomonas macrocytogenes]